MYQTYQTYQTLTRIKFRDDSHSELEALIPNHTLFLPQDVPSSAG